MFSPKRSAVISFSHPRKEALHGWFVFFPLYLYYLDERRIVIGKDYLKSFGFVSGMKSTHIVESPEDLGVEIGDEITW